MTIYIQIILLILFYPLTCNSSYLEKEDLMNSNGTFKPKLSEKIGLERIERDPLYYMNFFDYDNTLWPRSFGLFSMNKMYHCDGETEDMSSRYQQARWFSLSQPPGRVGNILRETSILGGINARTVTNDIRCALLDKDYFDTLLIEGDYFKAYQLCSENAQGQLWKRQVIAALKKEIQTLTLRSVYLQDEVIETQIRTIIISFREIESIHSELTTLYTAIMQKAEARKAALLANPQVAALAGSLKQQFISLMFGDLK